MTTYPAAPRQDTVDDYHGTPVADPYRYLEDPDNADTRAFIAAENELTQAYLSELPERDAFQARLTELWNFPRYSAPYERGRRLFYTLNDGLQNQAVLYVLDEPGAEPRVLLDPNRLSDDGTVALTNIAPSDDGRLLAYGVSVSGSDWQEIRLRDVATGEDLPDLIRWCKFTDIAWLPDGSGFYYARYPSADERQSGPLAGEPDSTHHRVFFHHVGTTQADDPLIYARPDARDLGFDPEVTDDGRYLVLRVWEGTDRRTRVYYLDLADESAEVVRLLDDLEARYTFLGNDGPLFYFLTDLDAPNGRLIAIDITRPERDAWRELVAEGRHALDSGKIIGDHFVLLRLEDASHRVGLYSLDGRPTGDIPLPDLGQVVDLQGRRDSGQAYLTFTSFLYPPTVLRYTFDTAEIAPEWDTPLPFDRSLYETTQVFYPSKDGTQVPMFLVHRAGLRPDGRTPALLYGYGGFTVNMLPMFSPGRILWLEQGGLYAQASLRGGNEYGEAWHAAGMLGNKQNVFDDFAAAAEYLVAAGYTKNDQVAIDGRSNGGLLTAASMLQRPECFGAVHAGVPVIDMLRYHRFTAGRYWTPEYGDAEVSADHFRFLLAYSPLHNVRAGVAYPPVLITTADTDDRVVPMHSLKFAATLQHAASYAYDPRRPMLLRVETRAGHGLGKPTGKLIEEAADIYAFLWHNVSR